MVVGFPSSGTYSSNVLDLVSFLIEVCLMEVSICRASNLKKSDETYWVVGLNANKLFCVVCKSPDLFPQVCMTSYIVYCCLTIYLLHPFVSSLLTQATPKPVLTLLDLSFPLAASDLGAESLENEFIVTNMHLSQVLYIFLMKLWIHSLLYLISFLG